MQQKAECYLITSEKKAQGLETSDYWTKRAGFIPVDDMPALVKRIDQESQDGWYVQELSRWDFQCIVVYRKQ